VSAALDAKQEIVLARKPHTFDHVGDAEAANHDGMPAGDGDTGSEYSDDD